MLKEGDEVEALVINVDRKTRSISLSIRAKDQAEQSEAMNKLASESCRVRRHHQPGRPAQGQAERAEAVS